MTRNTGPALTKSLNAGEIDFAPAAFTNLPAALERGIKVRAFVGYSGGSYTKPTSDNFVGMAARAGTNINKVTDVKGKKVGVTFGSTGDLWLRTILEANGIKTGDYQRINTRPPSLVSVLDTGGVDAIVAWGAEPDAFSRQSEGCNSRCSRRRPRLLLCWSARSSGKVYADRKKTQGVVDAMAQAAWYIRQPKNKDEVAQIGARFLRGVSPELIKRTMQHIVFDVRIGENTKKAWNFSVKQLIAQKKMKRPFDPDKYFDFSFINETMKSHPEWFADLSKS